MGNRDKWTTPKQIKIEREGEPTKETKRGTLKKGKRRKGRKARIDELLAEKKRAEYYRQHFHDDQKRLKEHPERYTPVRGLHPYLPDYKGWFVEHKAKLDNLIDRAVKDGVIDAETSDYYRVELYPF